jgi:hypothetical protein
MTLPIAIMYAVIGIGFVLAVLAGVAVVLIDRAERL